MASVRTFTGFGLLFFLFSCSALKVDSNCLNEKAGCFKPDKTAPTYKSIYPDITAAGVAELPYTDITFSEEMKGGELLENYALSGAGASSMSLASVTKVGPYTYRIYLNGSVNNGPIRIDFSKLNDYAGNSLANQTFIQYDGNTVMAVAVNAQYNRGGVSTNSGNGGYGTIAITFSHNYRSDTTNNTSWYIRITPGIVDCAAGVAWHSGSDGVGTFLPPLDTNNAATQLTRTFNATDFTNPYNAIVICMTNNTNPSAKAVGQWYVRRNDSVPVVTYVPPETDDYNSPIPVTLTCSGYPFRIAVTETSQQTSSPADPTPPAFDPNTGLVTTGTSFSTATANITAQNPVNPTRTKFSWRCIDVAGNMSSAQLNAALDTRIEYYVDSSIPAVNFTPDTAYHSFVSSGGYTSSTFKFSTDQAAGEQWLIKKGGTSCTSGGTTMYSGTVVAPGATITQVVNVGGNATTDFNAVGLYDIRICVHRAANNKWGTKYLLIERDDTAPTILSSVTSGSYGAVQQVSLSCTNNADVIAFTKAVQIGKTPPATPGNPAFLADGSDSATGPITLDDSSSTIIRYQCRDKAGNFSTIQQLNYTVDSTLPNITVVSNEHAALSNTGGYATSQLVWHSTRGGLPYEIRRGVADCTGGPGLGNANNILTGTTPAGLGNISVTLPVASFPGDGVTHDLKICVFNYIDSPTYQATVLQIKRDDTPPTFAGLQTLSSPASGSFTLGWTPVSDVVTYNIYRSTPPPTFGTTPDYTAVHPNANITVSGLNSAITYYFIAGAVDAAGNETKVTAAQLASKPTITLVVNGLSGSFNITDGTASATISADQNAAWTTTLGLGQSYAFVLTSQPTGQVCTVKEKQFGTLVSDLTITVNCATGYAVAGRFQAIPAEPLRYMLFRGNVTTPYVGTGTAVNGIAATANYIYLVRSESASTSSIQRCIPSNCGATITTIVNTTTAVFRHLVTDGSNLYVAKSDGASSTTRIYKYSALDLAQTTPQAIYDPGLTAGYPSGLAIDISRNLLYIGLRNVAQIKRLQLDTGAIGTLTSPVTEHEGMAMIGDDLYIGTPDNGNCLLKATSANTATAATLYSGACGATESYVDGVLLTARFARIHGMVSDGTDLYLSEFAGRRIRRVNVRTGIVSTIAGGSAGSTDGEGEIASFGSLFSMTTDGRSLYATEGGGGNRIRKISDKSLVGYWPLTRSSSLNLNDYASDQGTPLNGSIHGGGLGAVADRFGVSSPAVSFNGSSEYIDTTGMSGLPLGNAARTLCAWIKPGSIATGNSIIATYGVTNSNQSFGLYLSNSSGVISVGISAYGGAPYDLLVPYSVSTTTWTHLCGWTDSINARIYINGKQLISAARNGSGAFDTAIGGLNIGRQQTGSQFFNGSIADLRLYSRALNEGEINDLAQDAGGTAQVGPTFSTGATGLLAHYEFSGGTPPTANLAASGPLGGALSSSASSPIGKDGDAAGSAYFGGSAPLIGSVAGLPVGRAPRTICAFFSSATVLPTDSLKYIISYGGSGIGEQFALALANSGGVPQIDNIWGSSSISNDHIFAYTVPLNTWQHLCAVYDGTDSLLYMNGQYMHTKSMPSLNTTLATPGTAPFGFYIGSIIGGGQYFNGKIDDVRIYNNALSATQIRQLATQVPTGLLARLDFMGDSNDANGWSNNATSSGTAPALTTDRFNNSANAYSFSGSGKFQTSAPVTLIRDDVSLAAWFKPTAFSSGIHYMIINGDGGSGYGVFIDGNNGNVIRGILGGLGYMITTYVPPLNVWTHVVMQRTAGTWSISINGVSLPLTFSSITSSTAPTIPTSATFIGGDGGTFDYFTGDIDEARVYGRALTASEVRTLAGYHPMQVANSSTVIQMHLQPETAVYSGGGCAGGTNCISLWKDTSQMGNNVSQATGSMQPNLDTVGINGKPAVRFARASSTFLSGTCSPNLNSTPMTIYTVFKEVTISGGSEGFFQNGSPTSGRLFYMINTAPTRTPALFDLTHSSSGSPEIVANGVFHTAGEVVLFGTDYTGTAGNFYKNGSSVGVTLGAGYTANYCGGGTLDFGRYFYGGIYPSDGGYFDGHLGDFLYFNGLLNATSAYGANTDREIVECYLSAKYGQPLGHTCP